MGALESIPQQLKSLDDKKKIQQKSPKGEGIVYHSEVEWLKDFSFIDLRSLLFDKQLLLLQESQRLFKRDPDPQIPTLFITCDQMIDLSYSIKVGIQASKQDFLNKSFELQQKNQFETFPLFDGQIKVSQKGLFVNGLPDCFNYDFKVSTPLFITNLKTKGYVDIDCKKEFTNQGKLQSDSWIQIKAQGIHNIGLTNNTPSKIVSNCNIILKSPLLNNQNGRISGCEIIGQFDELKNDGLIAGICKSILISEKLDVGNLKAEKGVLILVTKSCNMTEENEILCKNLFIQCDDLDLKGNVKVTKDMIVRVQEGLDYKTENLRTEGKLILAFQNGLRLNHPIQTPGSLEITLSDQAVDPLRCLYDIQATKGLKFFFGSSLVFGSKRLGSIKVITQGSLEIFEDGLANEKEAELAVQHRFQSATNLESSIKIYGEFDVGVAIKIHAPAALLRIGSNKHKFFSKLILEKAHLTAYVSDFDLENGQVVASSAVIHAPQGICIGRLIEDPDRTIESTFYCHGQNHYSHNLGSYIANVEYHFLGQSRGCVYDGHHLVTLPVAISNQSIFMVTNQAELKGALKVYGTLKTGNLILDSVEDSVCKAASITVEQNFQLEGKGSLYLKREIGELHFDYFFPIQKVRDNYKFMASDPSRLEVYGTLSSRNSSSIVNEASIVYVHKKNSNISYSSSNFQSARHQKFVSRFGTGLFEEKLPPCPIASPANFIESSHGSVNVAREYLRKTRNFAGAEINFNAQFSSDQPTTFSNTNRVQGDLSAPSILAQISKDGLILGSSNSSLVKNEKKVLYDLMEDSFNLHTTFVSQMQDSFNFISLGLRFNFGYRERYWFNESHASKFYEDIASFVAIQTPQGAFKELDAKSPALFSLSPNLLKERIRKKCQEVLKRGYIYENSRIDDETVKQLHKNTNDYLLKIGHGFVKEGSQNSIKVQNRKDELPTEPMIYYVSTVNSKGFVQLSPIIYFPLKMIKNALGKRGGIRTNSLTILPKGLTIEQIATYFQDQSLLQPFLVNFNEDISLNSAQTGMNAEKQGQVCRTLDKPMSGSLSLHGDFDVGKMVVVSESHLQSDATIRAENILLASLCGNILIESNTERIGDANNFSDRIREKARIHARGILTILSGSNIVFSAAEINSELNTHIEALCGIYDVPLKCMQRRLEDYKSKRYKEKKEIVSITPHTSSYSSGKQITWKADNIVLSSVDVNAPKAVIEAQHNIELRDTHAEYQSSVKTTKRSLLRKRIHQEYSQERISKGSNFHNTDLYIKTNGDFAAVNLQNDGEIEIEAPEGEVKIDLGVNSYHSESFTLSSNRFREKRIHHTEESQTYTESFPSGLVKISALEAHIQQKSKRFEDSNVINNTGEPLKIEYVNDYHVRKTKVQKRLTQEFKSVLALTVGLATGYAGAAIASAAGIANTASVFAAECAMFKAGASSACSQLLMGAFENNFKFDFRSLVASMMTAGLTRFICQDFNIKPPPPYEIFRDGITFDNITQHFQYNATKSLVSNAVNVAVNQQEPSQALLNSCKETIVQTIGAVGANKIALLYTNRQIDYAGHKLAHGALGALTGGLQSSDPLKGMASGAQGAIVAEVVGGLLLPEDLESPAKESGHEVKFQMELEEDMKLIKDASHMAASLVAFATGQDVTIATSAADNALNNNFLMWPIIHMCCRISFLLSELLLQNLKEDVCQRVFDMTGFDIELIKMIYDSLTAVISIRNVLSGGAKSIQKIYIHKFSKQVASCPTGKIPIKTQNTLPKISRSEKGQIEGNNQKKTLLPGEGTFGTESQMRKVSKVGDNLDQHHMFSRATYERYGIPPKDRFVMLINRIVHKDTWSFGRTLPKMLPRDELAATIWHDLRLYREYSWGEYSYIRDNMAELIKMIKEAFPELMKKIPK